MKKAQLPRLTPDVNEGLSSAEVASRIANKQVNRVKKVVGKSYLQIFASNILTFFNLLGFIIFLLMLLCGSITNMMFIVIILANTAIGIFQEIRSKRAVEKLSIVSEPTVEVVRDGERQTIATRDIVLDDILLLSAGKQICCDSVLMLGEVEVNESMLTGESDAVKKKQGDVLYSGSYIISGNCTARCDKVGKDNYVEQLSARVKRAKTPDSQLMKGIRTIIKFISIIIFPLGLLTFFLNPTILEYLKNGVNLWREYVERQPNILGDVNDAILAMSGSMIGMVPSGMVLLTSVALAVAALKLARRKVLVRELPCIEMLARVDTLCLDKTGTITDGSMTVEEILPLTGEVGEIEQLIASVVRATGDDNMTAQALKRYFEDVDVIDSFAAIPFSSERKFSAATLVGKGTVAIGAAEFMFKKTTKEFTKQCNDLLKQGLRVLAVGQSKKAIKDGVADGLEPIAIIALQDTVRSDAPEIIKWFRDNDVAVKIISGDNPLSVSVIAAKVGVEGAEKYISLDGMTDEQVAEAANEYTVFGRVTPEQKAILVRSMKQAGRTVAMTGDGVNDILAMRESDCAISVGCGTDAAKTVANLVLMDNKFSSLPNVVAQGRQVVNNIQNSSSLFLMKTSMTILTTILCLILRVTYPFQPQNLYAVEFFVIGISSFLLALKPNRSLIKGRFIPNTLKSTLPSGVAMFLAVAMTYAFASILGLGDDQISTVAMFAMTATGVVALWILLFPMGKYNLLVGVVGTVGTVGSFLVFPWALGLLAKWAGDTDAAKMFVGIDSYAILFIALNALVMGGIVVGLKFLIKHIEVKRESRSIIKESNA
ncbi:MAG: HAD-IC family P-type ATPase [Clostridiales bacterium]|nr:HAD-IC family P-type ATPase [Clostridiales bacterium]